MPFSFHAAPMVCPYLYTSASFMQNYTSHNTVRQWQFLHAHPCEVGARVYVAAGAWQR